MSGKYPHMISACFLLFLGYGCIEYFEHSGIKDISGLLVVEGTIDSGETFIKLSRSGYINATIREYDAVENALVYVESNDGNRSKAGTHTEKENMSSQMELFPLLFNTDYSFH